MNNTYVTIITTLVRVFIVWLTGAMASHLSPEVYNIVNDTITKLGGKEVLISSIALALASAGLAIWLKLKSKLHLQIALELPQGATTADVRNAEANKSVTDVLTNPTPK